MSRSKSHLGYYLAEVSRETPAIPLEVPEAALCRSVDTLVLAIVLLEIDVIVIYEALKDFHFVSDTLETDLAIDLHV